MATQTKTVSGKLIAIVVALLLVIAAVVVLIVLNNSKPTSVMSCSVNPEVQFVLDQNNKVMQVNYLNEDAEVIFKEVKFTGKSAEDAAKLFVQLSTEAGKIDVDTTGTRVNVNISCENPDDFKDLQTKITNKVNEYFDENGIIAGAVTSLTEGVSSAIQKLGVEAKELAELTHEEIMALYQEKSDELKDVAVSLQDDLTAFIETLKNGVYATLDTLETQIASYEAQLERAGIPESVKETVREQLNTVKEQFEEMNRKFQEEVDKKLAELKEASKEIFEQAKQALADLRESVKAELSAHKTYFEQNKAEVQAKIKEYRDSLQNA